jgi:hypothetical protein
MTDGLTTLLRDEANTLRVPGAPAYGVLSAGRRLRRRRRASVAAAAAAVLVAGTVGVSALHSKPETRFEPADAGVLAGTTPTYVGRTVYLDAATRVSLEEQPFELLYSAAGLVVVTSPTIHGLPPYHLTLVSPDGTSRPLGETLSMLSVAVEQGTSYLTWADRTSDGFDVVVHDLATNRDVARVPVHGPYQPHMRTGQMRMSIDGDMAYVITEGGGYAVDWHTGHVTAMPSLAETRAMSVYGGHLLDERTHQVTDVATGKVLLDYGVRANAQLSPDGRYVEVEPVSGVEQNQGAMLLYDVSTGRHVELTGRYGMWGWTPEGRPLGVVLQNGSHEPHGVDRKILVTCDPLTGRCDGSPYNYEHQLAQQAGGHAGFFVGVGGIG